MRDFLRKLNSATQYPSIPTYHKFGQRGRLTEERNVVFDEPVIVTEKINGVNARIIVPPKNSENMNGGWPYGWVVGSRTELLAAQHDIVKSLDYGIVEAVEALADRIAWVGANPDVWTVLYGEVYGNVPGFDHVANANYAGSGNVGFAVFDVATFSPEILDREVEQIAAWRDRGGQTWSAPGAPTHAFTEWHELNMAPVLREEDEMPVSVEHTYAWLYTVTPAVSLATLDPGARGAVEGVIVRTRDRSKIAKIRFEEYERTMRARR